MCLMCHCCAFITFDSFDGLEHKSMIRFYYISDHRTIALRFCQKREQED